MKLSTRIYLSVAICTIAKLVWVNWVVIWDFIRDLSLRIYEDKPTLFFTAVIAYVFYLNVAANAYEKIYGNEANSDKDVLNIFLFGIPVPIRYLTKWIDGLEEDEV